MAEPVALSGPQRIIRRIVAERRAGAPDEMIAKYAITEALHLFTRHDGPAADCTRCHNATARAVHDVRSVADMTGASIVIDPETPHRLTVRLIPHRDLAGVDQGPRPHRELQHTEACDRLKYGQRCPFDDRDDMDDWPAEPGEYEGWYWAGRNWTDAGWEYDAGIEWQRTEDMERFREALSIPDPTGGSDG